MSSPLRNSKQNTVPPLRGENGVLPQPKQNWGPDKLPALSDILQDKGLCDAFARFLEETFCQETLLFYLAAEDYEKIEDPVKRKQMFMEIINRFLVDGSAHPKIGFFH